MGLRGQARGPSPPGMAAWLSTLLAVLLALAPVAPAPTAGPRAGPMDVWVVSIPPASSASASAPDSAQVVEEARPVEAAVHSVVEGVKSILRSSEDAPRGPHTAPLADLAVHFNELAGPAGAWSARHDDSAQPEAPEAPAEAPEAPAEAPEAVGQDAPAEAPPEVLEAMPSPDTTTLETASDQDLPASVQEIVAGAVTQDVAANQEHDLPATDAVRDELAPQQSVAAELAAPQEEPAVAAEQVTQGALLDAQEMVQAQDVAQSSATLEPQPRPEQDEPSEMPSDKPNDKPNDKPSEEEVRQQDSAAASEPTKEAAAVPDAVVDVAVPQAAAGSPPALDDIVATLEAGQPSLLPDQQAPAFSNPVPEVPSAVAVEDIPAVVQAVQDTPAVAVEDIPAVVQAAQDTPALAVEDIPAIVQAVPDTPAPESPQEDKSSEAVPVQTTIIQDAPAEEVATEEHDDLVGTPSPDEAVATEPVVPASENASTSAADTPQQVTAVGQVSADPAAPDDARPDAAAPPAQPVEPAAPGAHSDVEQQVSAEAIQLAEPQEPAQPLQQVSSSPPSGSDGVPVSQPGPPGPLGVADLNHLNAQLLPEAVPALSATDDEPAAPETAAETATETVDGSVPATVLPAAADAISALNNELTVAASPAELGGDEVRDDVEDNQAADSDAPRPQHGLHTQAAQINMDLSVSDEQPVVSEAVLDGDDVHHVDMTVPPPPESDALVLQEVAEQVVEQAVEPSAEQSADPAAPEQAAELAAELVAELAAEQAAATELAPKQESTELPEAAAQDTPKVEAEEAPQETTEVAQDVLPAVEVTEAVPQPIDVIAAVADAQEPVNDLPESPAPTEAAPAEEAEPTAEADFAVTEAPQSQSAPEAVLPTEAPQALETLGDATNDSPSAELSAQSEDAPTEIAPSSAASTDSPQPALSDVPTEAPPAALNNSPADLNDIPSDAVDDVPADDLRAPLNDSPTEVPAVELSDVPSQLTDAAKDESAAALDSVATDAPPALQNDVPTEATPTPLNGVPTDLPPAAANDVSTDELSTPLSDAATDAPPADDDEAPAEAPTDAPAAPTGEPAAAESPQIPDEAPESAASDVTDDASDQQPASPDSATPTEAPQPAIDGVLAETASSNDVPEEPTALPQAPLAESDEVAAEVPLLEPVAAEHDLAASQGVVESTESQGLVGDPAGPAKEDAQPTESAEPTDGVLLPDVETLQSFNEALTADPTQPPRPADGTGEEPTQQVATLPAALPALVDADEASSLITAINNELPAAAATTVRDEEATEAATESAAAPDNIKSPGEPFLQPEDPGIPAETEEEANESNAVLEEADEEKSDEAPETPVYEQATTASSAEAGATAAEQRAPMTTPAVEAEPTQASVSQGESSEEQNNSSEEAGQNSSEELQSGATAASSSETSSETSSEEQGGSSSASSEEASATAAEVVEQANKPDAEPLAEAATPTSITPEEMSEPQAASTAPAEAEQAATAAPTEPEAESEATTGAAALAEEAASTAPALAEQGNEPVNPPAAAGSTDQQVSQVLQPVRVEWLRVRSEVQLRFAHTLVRAAIHNPASRAQEVQLQLALPETGYVTGMSLESGGQTYKAYVRERRKADGEYQQAALGGHTTAQVRQNSARDSSVMSLLVTVAARSSLTVHLTYEELLVRRRGRYHHAVSIDPGQDVGEVRVDVFILEPRNLTSLGVCAAGKELYAVDTRDIAQHGLQNYTAGPLSVRRYAGNMAHLQVVANGEQQLQLWQPQSRQDPHAPVPATHPLPALTFTYDVDRSAAASGDLILLDGYFVHFFAPPEVPPLRKHAIFVLDTSGSMWGHKLRQLQTAMTRILDSLHPDDFFSIVQFSSHVTEWSPHTLEVVGLRDKEATLPANKDHINKAKKFINGMEASGGTNIGGALRSAVRLAGKRDYDRWPTYRAGSADRPQPIIVFLTDGLPTVGTLSLGRVLAQTRAQNAEIKAAIFSLSFGTRSNWRFLQRLSLQNDGFARRIYEAGDAAQQLQDFYQEISSPLLANVTFSYVTTKVEGSTVTRRSFPLMYGGSELVVAGRVADGMRSLEAEVEVWGAAPGASAAVGAAPGRMLLRAQAYQARGASRRTREDIAGLVPPPLPGKNKKKGEATKPPVGILERLWAYLSVQQLLDMDLIKHEEDIVDEAPAEEPGLDQPRRRALWLALKYGFVTRVTSLVVVQPTAEPNGTLAVREAPLRPVPADGGAERDAENLAGNNKFGEIPLTRPGPGHIPMSFKPLLLAQADNATETQSLPLTAISWLSQHTDSAGRLRLGPAAFSLELPPKQELQRLMSAAANQCPGRSCRPLADCVQPAVAASFMVFRDYFCPLGTYAGVCCSF